MRHSPCILPLPFPLRTFHQSVSIILLPLMPPIGRCQQLHSLNWMRCHCMQLHAAVINHQKRIQKLATQVKHSALAYIAIRGLLLFIGQLRMRYYCVMLPTKCLGEWSTCSVPFSVSSDRPQEFPTFCCFRVLCGAYRSV